jgi:hypothetical protein
MLISVLLAAFACSRAPSASQPSAPSAQADSGATTGGASAAGTSGSDQSLGGAVAAARAPTGSGTGGTQARDAARDAGATQTGLDAGMETTAPDGANAIAACSHCTSFAEPKTSGTIAPPELDSLSGIALSRKQPEVLFAHNDHNRPVVYALDLQGRLHATITLTGATPSDLEDIALGPCGPDSCLYLADIGDNSASRDEYAVLRFVEPSVPSQPGNSAIAPQFERFRFTYPDGSHNAESLLIAPDGTLYIITKLAPGSGGRVQATGPSSVYRLPQSALQASKVAQATLVGVLPIPKSGELALSAAAAHPCAHRVLVRTYDRVYELAAPDGAEFEAAFAVAPKIVAMPQEPQSEGIDYRPDGRGFVTSGEGSHAPIMLTDCGP